MAMHHDGQLGLVHATYSFAEKLRKTLGNDPRFIFHTKLDAKDRLYDWMDRKDPDAQVFIASGFEEGLDLAGDAYTWQVITKVPFPSLGDVAIKKRSDADPRWYTWQTLRKIIQAVGRISRGPEDFGVTYIIDGHFERLVRDAARYDLLPRYVREVLDPKLLRR
jgi:Rad3-related DNA helicase